MKHEKPPGTLKTQEQLFHELTYYTISQTDPAFNHQHAADAFAAQRTDENTKTITIIFALVGLYLMLEKALLGKKFKMHI